MTILKIMMDEREISVCIVNEEHEFKALTKNLLENITKKQIDQITTIIRNKRIIVYRDLMDCYSCDGYKKIGYETCLCGKKNINEVFSLENKENHQRFHIGSTCVSNWIYKNQYEDRNCLFCHRKNKTGENCKNCKEKTKIKTIFKTWKKYVQDLNSKVDFGRYMNLITYQQLCREESYDDYRSSILSDSCWIVMQDVKNKIIKFIN